MEVPRCAHLFDAQNTHLPGSAANLRSGHYGWGENAVDMVETLYYSDGPHHNEPRIVRNSVRGDFVVDSLTVEEEKEILNLPHSWDRIVALFDLKRDFPVAGDGKWITARQCVEDIGILWFKEKNGATGVHNQKNDINLTNPNFELTRKCAHMLQKDTKRWNILMDNLDGMYTILPKLKFINFSSK